MELVREQLLELIRCSMWDTNPSASLFDSETDWRALLRLAQRQSVLGSVYAQLEKLESKPNQKSSMRLHSLITLNRKMRLRQLAVLDIVTKRLQEGGIARPVLLKGVGVGENYPDPGVRQCGDIDLYVGKEHYEKSCEMVKSWSESEIEYNSMSRKHYHFKFNGVIVEIHRLAIVDTNITKHRSEFIDWCVSELEGDRLRHEQIEGVDVYLPPYEFDAIYIFKHAWNHFCTSGIAFRQISDWALHITKNHDKIDQNVVRERLEYFGLTAPWGFFGAMAVNTLGLKESMLTAFDQSKEWYTEKIVNRIWDGGNFGFYNGKYAGSSTGLLKREWINFKAIFRSSNFLCSIDRGYGYNYFFATIAYTIKTKFMRFYYIFTKQ